MSDSPSIVGVHRATRVRMLGDAMPVVRGAYHLGETVPVPKTADELRAETDERRDSQPMATSCGIDGCDFTHTGTAGECRSQAAQHRAHAHPGLKQTHRHGGVKFKRRGEPVPAARVAESRRIRQEKDDQARLDTIQRGRAARGEPLEEAASADGDVGAASSSSARVTTERTPVSNQRPYRRWTRETIIAALQTVAAEVGHTPTSRELQARSLSSFVTLKVLRIHGFDSYASLCLAAGLEPNTTGRKGGTARAVKTDAGVPPDLVKTVDIPAEPVQAAAPTMREAPPGLRDPLRTGDIPYDASILSDEAAFLRRRAAALEQLAAAINVLASPNDERAA